MARRNERPSFSPSIEFFSFFIEDGRDLALVLLKEGARLNEQDTYGMTALHHAIQRGNKAMAKFLIDYTGILLDQAVRERLYKRRCTDAIFFLPWTNKA